MTLQMKTNCQICDQSLEQDSEAYICVYECTFCAPCTEKDITFAQTAAAS